MLRQLLPLIAIIFVAWLLVLSGTVIIFGYIAHFNPAEGIISPLGVAVLKVVLGALLAVAWILILYFLTIWYVRRSIKPTS
ncbi:MAG: hypothetical protein HA494_04245 [Thaumarchaeota archaeon]|jgi:hypothetical protein|nr:hypothetical protein [Nitrososphaerota archaeon]